ncbi:MAG: recombinase family protein [Gammaproteobacteria bacterium]
MRNYKNDHRNPRRLRYGWKLTQSGHITIDPAQRACVYFILAWRRDGRTLQQICDALDAGGWPAPRQGRWYCATVRKIIEQNAALYAVLPRVPRSSQAPCTDTRRVVDPMHQGVREVAEV